MIVTTTDFEIRNNNKQRKSPWSQTYKCKKHAYDKERMFVRFGKLISITISHGVTVYSQRVNASSCNNP